MKTHTPLMIQILTDEEQAASLRGEHLLAESLGRVANDFDLITKILTEYHQVLFLLFPQPPEAPEAPHD